MTTTGKFKKIICLDFNGDEISQECWDKIDNLSHKRAVTAENELPQHSDTDALLVKLGARIPGSIMDKLPKLTYVGMMGTGYGGIDINHAKKSGITVTNIADYATEGVAEFTFGILLEHYRDIAKARIQAKDGNYSDNFGGSEIKGKKFGVIGLGGIGRRTAQIAQVFGADVSYWSRNRKQDAEKSGINYKELDELIAESDIITLNLAYNPETEGIITAAHIESLGKGTVFINPSPMELVDFEVLNARLKENDTTFIFDHTDEMTEEQLKSLQPLDNAIAYPPIAYLTSEASELKQQIYVDNIKNYLSHLPSNQVA